MIDEAKPMPLSEWDEKVGPALWWKFPIIEEPWVGSPLDDYFPSDVTHFTRIVVPHLPEEPVRNEKYFCPEHGSSCGGESCCCADKHMTLNTFLAWRIDNEGLVPSLPDASFFAARELAANRPSEEDDR